MKKTLGIMIAELRKEQGMTQMDLAEKMGVTDKAVSKWERDLSCPDINSLPTLAELLGVSVDELMQLKRKAETSTKSINEIVGLVCNALAVAMGIAVTVLSILNSLDVESGIMMLGIGLTFAGISLLKNRE